MSALPRTSKRKQKLQAARSLHAKSLRNHFIVMRQTSNRNQRAQIPKRKEISASFNLHRHQTSHSLPQNIILLSASCLVRFDQSMLPACKHQHGNQSTRSSPQSAAESIKQFVMHTMPSTNWRKFHFRSRQHLLSF